MSFDLISAPPQSFRSIIFLATCSNVFISYTKLHKFTVILKIERAVIQTTVIPYTYLTIIFTTDYIQILLPAIIKILRTRSALGIHTSSRYLDFSSIIPFNTGSTNTSLHIYHFFTWHIGRTF